MVFTGVLLLEIVCLISSNFLATEVAADLMLLIPPCRSSLDFLLVRLGLKIIGIISILKLKVFLYKLTTFINYTVHASNLISYLVLIAS